MYYNRSHKNPLPRTESRMILSPLALVILAACGGGGGSNVTTFTRSGSVVKGPLKDALAFLDYDDDGEWDADEPSVRTDADGNYSLTGAASKSGVNLVAVTDSSTIDTSSGSVLADVVLSAPATASVVSMASTLMVESDMTEAQVQEALGIVGDVDLLSFNPFDVGATATDAQKQLARDVEVTSQKVSAVVTSMAAAAKASGVSAADSFKASLEAVSTFVKEQSDATATVDLTDTTQLTAVADKVATAVTAQQTAARQAVIDAGLDPDNDANYATAGVAKVTATAFDGIKSTIVTAVKNVNDVIDTVTKDDFSASESVYSVAQALVEQVSEATTKEVATPGTGGSTVTFTKAATVTAAKSNPAPTDIDLTVNGTTLDSEASDYAGVLVSEGTGTLAIAAITATDLLSDGTTAETSFTYTLSGTDASSFTITDGVLYFNSQPDYEEKSSYEITISAKDSGGKSYAEKFTIKIADIDEATFAKNFQIVANGAEDAVFTDYVKGTTTEASRADVDVVIADGTANFGTLDVDLPNLNAGLSSTAGFQDPTLTVKLEKLPTITGGSKTETVKIKVTEGADASRDAATERAFELSFDVVMTDSGGFAITPQTAIKVVFNDRGEADGDNTEVTLTVPSNDTFSYSTSDQILSVKLLSLVNELPTSILPSSVLGSGGSFHVSMTGLPLMDETGSEVSSLEGVLAISDRNHTPQLPELAGKSATDGGASVTGTIVAANAESGETITYGITGEGAASAGAVTAVGTYGNLSINQTTGAYEYVLKQTAAQITAVEALGASATAEETFEFTASDGTSIGKETLTFTVTGINQGPESVVLRDANDDLISSPSFDENITGASAGNLSATDADGDAVTYTIKSDVGDAALFEVAALGGAQVLKLKDTITPNYEAKTSYSVTVIASDGTLTENQAFTIAVNDVNEAPSLAKPSSKTVTENSGVDVTGTLVASDQDAGDTKEFKIVHDNAVKLTDGSNNWIATGTYGKLTVNAVTGAYSYDLYDGTEVVNALTTGQTITTENFGIVAVDSSSAESTQRTLSIKINGFNDAPDTIALSNASLSENVAAAEVGTITSNDPEGDAVTYTLVASGDHDKFEITSGGVLKLIGGVSADYETNTTFTVTVKASDGNSDTTQDFTITVVDVEDEVDQFRISSDNAADTVFTDYINGTEEVQTNIDLTNTAKVLNFGTVYVDANNAALATSGSGSFKSPELSFTLDALPTLSAPETRTVTLTVTEGADGTRVSGERQAVVTFDLLLESADGVATLTAAAGGIARVDYYSGAATTAATLNISNVGSNDISFSTGVNGSPSSLNLKVLELLDKVSILNPTSILGEGATLHVKVEGLPLASHDEAEQTVTAVEGTVIVKDLIAPESTVARAAYDSVNGQIVIQGTKFDDLDVAIGGDVKSYLDWTKLSWDLDGSGSASGVTFVEADIASAIVSNAETITITLTSVKKTALASADGYSAGFDSDTMTVTTGFIRDKALNTTKNATDGLNNTAVVNLDELIRISTDTSADAVVTDYLGSVSSATRTTNVDLTATNGVLSLGSVELDINNIENALSGSGASYLSPDLTLTIDDAAVISGSNSVPVTISILDGSDGTHTAASERKIDVSFTLTMSGDGTTSSLTSAAASPAATVTYYPAGGSAVTVNVNNLDPNTLTITEGSNGLPSTIKVRTLTLLDKLSSINATDVLGTGGDFYLTVSGLPIADEFGPITEVTGQLTIKDLVPPISTVSSAVYNDTAGTITLTGTNFNTIGVNDGDSVKAQLDFTKLKWDIDGSGAASVSFTADDFSAAVVTNSTTLTLTLTSDAKSSLEGTAGFAAAGTNGEYGGTTNVDKIDVDQGFISDVAGNVSVTDAVANAELTYSDTTAPTIVKIDTTSADGAYGVGKAVNITATLLEPVLKGSKIEVTLNSQASGGVKDKVTLTAETTGTDLVGTYTVPDGRTAAGDLTIDAISAGTASISAYDIYGVQFAQTSVAEAKNLAFNSNITIDTQAPKTTITSVEYNPANGVLAFTGDNFTGQNGLGVAAGQSVKEYLDWTKLEWDIDASDTDSALSNVTFALADIDTAVLTTDELMTVTLTADGKAKLHAATGFAQDGDATNPADAVDANAGFLVDAAGNVAEVFSGGSSTGVDYSKDNATVTYTDDIAPTVTGFTSSSDNGAYGAGSAVNITATMSERVTQSSTMTVTLETGTTDKDVSMTASADGMTMVGSYVVDAGHTSGDLTVKEFVKGTVKDIYGNALTNEDNPVDNNLANNKAIVIDTQAPNVTIDSAKYDGATGKITFTGSGFEDIEVGLNTDIKTKLDWTKLEWDIDASDTDSGLANVTFAVGDIQSATYTGDTTLVVELTSAKKAALEAAPGFAAMGDATYPSDKIVVSDGFVRDRAENPASADGKSMDATYVNPTTPTVVSFDATNANGQYGLGKEIVIVATMSEKVISGSSFTITLNTGSSETVVLTADDTDATGLTLKGTYTVPSGKKAPNGLDVSSFVVGSVKDIYGKAMTSDDLPSGSNLADNKSLIIDTLAPITEITSAEYDVVENIITLVAPSSTGFDTLDVANGTDVKDQLGWKTSGDAYRFSWDLDGDSTTPDVGFEASDFEYVKVISATQLDMKLNATGLAKLTSEASFGGAQADGTAASTSDTIDVTAGFMVDAAGNVGADDGKANAEIAFSDTTRPTVTSFTSTNASGSYKEGDTINITANMSETVLKGSSFTVTLNNSGTTQTQVLEATATGTTLVGSYVVQSGITALDLGIQSYASLSVTDFWGNTLNTDSIPSGKNLSNSKDIVIDTEAPEATIASVEYNGTLGVLTFTGTNYDTLGVANGGSLVGNLNWDKFSWDVDATDTTTSPALSDISISASDVASATLVGDDSFTVTLTAAGKAALEASDGFAAKGASGTAGVDTIDITAGFLMDTAGNLVSDGDDADSLGDDQKDDAVISYTDKTAPTVTGFTSTSADGTYGLGQTINVTATMSERVIEGSTMEVTFNNTGTTQTQVLTADTTDATGKTLVGTYTVGSNVTAADLGISSFTSSITDLYGNRLSDETVPSGENLSNNSAIVIDTQAPGSTISSATYNATSGVLTLKGSGFEGTPGMGVANGSDVKSQLDFAGAKLVWDVNDDGSTTADVTIAASDVDTAVMTNDTTITITLTSAAKDALAATAGFGASGGDDTIDVSAGFISDKAGNVATGDAKANAAITYSDTSGPTVTEFVSTSANGYYGIGSTVNITANMSEKVLAGAKITATLGTTEEVELTTASDGTSLSGTYTVASGQNSADLTVSSYALGTGSYVVQDIFGNEASSTALPSGENLSDNAAIVIDTKIPTATVSSAKYNGSTGVITITGENFDSINASNGADVKSYLNWSNLSWDIDGDSTSTDFAFTEAKIASAILTNETTLTVTLTSDAKTALETTSNFAAAGSADKLDVTAGFIKDIAGNAATSDVKANAAITYTDVTAPKVTSFFSTTSNGTYGENAQINISATVSETVQAGSSFQVTLGTSDVVTLTAATSGTTLTTSTLYLVSAGDSSPDLNVASYTTGDVKDVYGNAMASTALPSGENLADNAAIVIDTVPVFNDGTATVNGTAAAGDTIVLKFSEAVDNYSAVAAQITGADKYGVDGSRATADWNTSTYKTLTITLGVGETYNGTDDIVLTNVDDVAGNTTETLTFTV